MEKSAIYCFSIFIIVIAALLIISVAAVSLNESPPDYALRPAIEIVNWGGSTTKIRFPYQDYKYILDRSNSYEFIETDVGYDLVIHFGRFERGEN